MNDKTDDLTEAKVSKLKSWSPVWIIPIVTVLIGAWILISHFRGQGPEITLITYNAEGVEAGKTKIKSRSVDVGVVESVMLDQSYSRVIIKARLNAEMKDVLRKDTVFWVVKPTVGREGVSAGHTAFRRISRCSLPIPAANAMNLNCLIHRRWRLRTPKGSA